MNQAQRSFLIKKIKDSVDTKIRLLKNTEIEPPSLSNYILHIVMSGTFEIITNEEIKKLIRQKALNSKAGKDNWMSTVSSWSQNKELSFEVKEFFILPEEYKKLWTEYKIEKEKIDLEIYNLQIQSDGLITRIQLASDKTLQTMINEVDDMGNISLMDTRLKALTSPLLNKALNE